MIGSVTTHNVSVITSQHIPPGTYMVFHGQLTLFNSIMFISLIPIDLSDIFDLCIHLESNILYPFYLDNKIRRYYNTWSPIYSGLARSSLISSDVDDKFILNHLFFCPLSNSF